MQFVRRSANDAAPAEISMREAFQERQETWTLRVRAPAHHQWQAGKRLDGNPAPSPLAESIEGRVDSNLPKKQGN